MSWRHAIARGLADFRPTMAGSCRYIGAVPRLRPAAGAAGRGRLGAWLHRALCLAAAPALVARVAAFVYPPVFALPIVALFGFVHGGDEALMRLDS